MSITSADTGQGAVATAVLRDAFTGPAVGGRRGAGLRRLLVVADALAGAAAGVLSGFVAGATIQEIALTGLGVSAAWPLLAFICGLYSVDDLRSWASGVSEAPKLAVAALLLSWPMYGLFATLGTAQAARAALAGSVL